MNAPTHRVSYDWGDGEPEGKHIGNDVDPLAKVCTSNAWTSAPSRSRQARLHPHPHEPRDTKPTPTQRATEFTLFFDDVATSESDHVHRGRWRILLG